LKKNKTSLEKSKDVKITRYHLSSSIASTQMSLKPTDFLLPNSVHKAYASFSPTTKSLIP